MTCNGQCQPNASINNQGACVCNSGYVMSGNQCVRSNFGCPPTQVWSGTRCICLPGLYPDFISGQCSYCNSFDRMIENDICTCSRLYYPTLDGCSACKSNSLYDKTLKKCVCNIGFSEINGQCLSNPLITNCPS